VKCSTLNYFIPNFFGTPRTATATGVRREPVPRPPTQWRVSGSKMPGLPEPKYAGAPRAQIYRGSPSPNVPGLPEPKYAGARGAQNAGALGARICRG